MFSFRNPTPLWPKTFSWMDGTWRYWWVTGSSMPLGSSHWLSWLNSRSTFLSWLWSHFQLSSSFWPFSSHILLIWRMSTEFCKFNSLEWKDSFPRNRAWVCQEVKVDFIPYFSLNVLYIRSAIFTWYVCTASILMNVIWPRKNIRIGTQFFLCYDHNQCVTPKKLHVYWFIAKCNLCHRITVNDWGNKLSLWLWLWLVIHTCIDSDLTSPQ